MHEDVMTKSKLIEKIQFGSSATTHGLTPTCSGFYGYLIELSTTKRKTERTIIKDRVQNIKLNKCIE